MSVFRPLPADASADAEALARADGLLAAGARPMMTTLPQDAPAMTGVADALLANLGTLSGDGAEAIPRCVRAAARGGIPWVLDPAAIGVPPRRTALARELLALRPAVVRANASEVLALLGRGRARGADASHAVEEAADAAAQVARETGGAVAVSGPVDLIVSAAPEPVTVRLGRGSPLLARVTGTGCLLGALTAACLGAGMEPVEAGVGATSWLCVAGELAAAGDPGPGTFRVRLLDALDGLGT